MSSGFRAPKSNPTIPKERGVRASFAMAGVMDEVPKSTQISNRLVTIWVLGDQLSLEHAALARAAREDAVVLMVESKARGNVLRYHQQKLVLIYSAMRHFAEELRRAGWTVDYTRLEEGLTFESAARRHLERHRPERLVLAEPNSFLERDALEKLGRKLKVEVEFVPSTQFLCGREEFIAWVQGKPRLLMERHYERMRRKTGWLMRDGKPEGGAWNFDHDNRATHKDWEKAGAPVARMEKETPDAMTQEVMAMVEREFPGNPGNAAGFWLPVDRAGARRWLETFVAERLPHFGKYEDMMSTLEPVLFHSLLSPMLNIGLLSPAECAEAALRAYAEGRAPLNSVEGFVRQIIGWREFIHGVYWLRGPEYKTLNALGAERPLPGWFYTGEVPMNCLRTVLRQVIETGWNHHIQRLMVLGNFFLLAGIRPQEALRWFMEMYVDAFDWVMAANVIGMVCHADGGFMATKPYAGGGAYIQRMSDYCKGCQFSPDIKTGPGACPYNYLYWNFFDTHSERFLENQRTRMVVSSWLKRPEAEKQKVRESAREFLETYVSARD